MKINDIVLDSTTKDYVLITNGIPLKDVDGKETRELTPTEGIVLRYILSSGLFWSYISIAGHKLHATQVTMEEGDKEFSKAQGRI